MTTNHRNIVLIIVSPKHLLCKCIKKEGGNKNEFKASLIGHHIRHKHLINLI